MRAKLAVDAEKIGRRRLFGAAITLVVTELMRSIARAPLEVDQLAPR
jgi:hypothetical protein